MSTLKTAPRWVLPEEDRANTRQLATELRLPGVIAQLLLARGVSTADEARHFLNAKDAPLTDPFQLSDMDKAVARITAAREAGEHIRVFGDYDVDGMSATAILYRGLARFGVKTLSYAMPDRLTEGYGINPQSVANAKSDGVSLLITVDNGISAHEAADTAQEQGIDLIVTDHHHIEGSLPNAYAVINPKRDDPDSPFADACGAAVAFKLCSALTGSPADFDLVALATVADVVPLRRENRTLVELGLREISGESHLGIQALIRKAGLRPKEMRAENIAFQLAPRINASGRLGDAKLGLQLLLTDSEEEAGLIASQLDALNVERRRIEDGILEEAREEIEATLDPSQRTIVVARAGWHPGVIGIVAARLQNAYWRPAALIALDDNGLGRSSCRSTPDFNIVEALGECKHLLVKYGGHHAAAGMTIEEDHVEEFKEAFEAAARKSMPQGERSPELKIDALLSLSDIDSDLLHAIDALEPFGSTNAPPLFASFGVSILPKSARALRGGHLKCRVQQGNRSFNTIGFNLADAFAQCDSPQTVDIAYRPKFNTWRGETTVQLELKGIRPA